MPDYCDYAPDDPVHQSYHATEYGFPTTDESVLMERLALEIFQAGLSWGIVLKKRAATFDAFEDFQVDKVAAYGDQDVARLLGNAGIIRNRLKIHAIIHNANVVMAMRDSHDGFDGWIKSHHPMAKPDWVKLFKKTFKFTGGEITGEFLMSTGYLPGAHRKDCPIFADLKALSPPWMQVDQSVYS